MRKVKTRKSIKKEDYEDLIYYKLKSNRFKQQRLPAWRPIPTLWSIIIFYFFFGIIFITLGIIILIFSGKIISQEIPYNEECKNEDNQDPNNKNVCIMNVTIKENMKAPIMIYYKLNGFYQNHRRYIRSKSQNQLYGKSSDTGDCDPIYTNKDMGFEEGRESAEKKEDGTEPTPLDLNSSAIPCGLMAKTFFNDTFYDWNIIGGGSTITVNESNIAFDKDKELFKTVNLSKQWIDMKDEHFIVWMRPAGLPNFRKLWGRINDGEIKKDDILNFKIKNTYNVDYYSGTKSIILTTNNKFGGKNGFMGVCFIVVGIISLVLGFAFPLLIYQRNKNESLKKNI